LGLLQFEGKKYCARIDRAESEQNCSLRPRRTYDTDGKSRELTRTVIIEAANDNQASTTSPALNLYASIVGKWVELFKEIAPRPNRVAVVFNPDTPVESYLGSIEAAALALGMSAIRTAARNPLDVVRAHDALGWRFDRCRDRWRAPSGALSQCRWMTSDLNVRHCVRWAVKWPS
jgi:hypothetical protein